MKNILISFLTIFVLISISLSSTVVDSLLSRLPEATDIEKVDIYVELITYYSIPIGKRIEYAEKAVELATELEYLDGKALALNSLGVEYDFFGDHEQAMVYYLESLAILESTGDPVINVVLNNLGTLHSDMLQFEKSLEYLNRSLEYLADNDSSGFATYYNNVANIYSSLGDQDTALNYYKMAGDYYISVDDRDGIAMIYNNIADINNSIGNFDIALENGLKSIELYDELGDTEGQIYALMTIGETYSLMKNFNKALEYFQLASERTEGLGSLELESYIYEVIYQTYYSKGDFKQAFDHLDHYSELNDSLFGLESVNEINRMQVLFETEKKAKEIEILKKEAEVQITQRNTLIVGFVSILAIAFTLLINNRSRKKLNVILQKQNREIRIKNDELSELNDQLKNAIAEVKSLSGMLPICANCKKIRDDQGYWNQVEIYIKDHSDVHFSHGICPDCIDNLYPEMIE
jgi:tetratricopeptide (TPR) repeat protein